LKNQITSLTKKRTIIPGRSIAILLALLVLFGLYLISIDNYLLFHSLVELFSIVIAFGVFVIAWNSRRFLDNNYLMFIAIAYLFIAGLDLIHTLAYTGMGVFQGYGSNLPTQLWIAARYLQGFSLLVAPLLFGRRLNVNLVFAFYAIVFTFLLASIFYWDIFPTSFVEGVGLTPFKRISEYIISIILTASLVLLAKHRNKFDRSVFRLLFVSIFLTICAELAFTFYVSVYGLSNLIGHIFKLISFYLIYLAIIQTGLTKPFNLLFRNLKHSEEALAKHRDRLEELVAEQTTEIKKTNKELKIELTERKRAEERIKHLNITLRAVRNVNQLITREKDKERLIQQSCDILVRDRSYSLAWIALVDKKGKIISKACSGVPSGSFYTFIDQMEQVGLTHCMRALLQQKKPFLVTGNVSHAHEGCPMINVHKGGAGFACRLEYEGKLYGTMSIDVPSDLASDKEEQGLFRELCGDISFALANIEREEERRWTENKLYESENKYRSLITNVRLGIFRSTPGASGRFLEVNPAMERITGYTRDELLKMNISDLYIHPEEREFVLEKTIRAAGKATEELNFKKKDGTQIIVSDTKTPVIGSNEKVLYFDGILEDITERKKAEERLIESQERFRAIFDNATDGILLADSEARVFYQGNRMICQMLGYSEKELRNLGVNDIHPEQALPYVIEQFEKQARGEITIARDIPVKRRDGSVFYADVNSAPVILAGKTYLISIFRDISERKQMEEQLIVADRLASIGELSAGIAHELNNPLTGVIGLSQLLTERDLPDDIKEDLKLVYSEAQRAADVVRNLLTFGRKHPPLKQLVNLSDVIDKVLKLRSYEQRVSNIEVIKHFAPDLPQIMADYFQLQQVFLNIIINAEQIMTEVHGKGTLTITTKRVGEFIRASFADDGPGIPEENLGHIFDPFFTTKEVGKGTGLGLSICHGVINAHGGRIYAASEPGEGATFIIELPITKGEEKDEEI